MGENFSSNTSFRTENTKKSSNEGYSPEKYKNPRAELLNLNRNNEVESDSELNSREEEQLELLFSGARNMNEMSRKARDAIKSDMRTLETTERGVDENTTAINKHNDLLDEINRSGTICGTLTTVLFIFVMFIMMVVFIRLFPNVHLKKR